MTYTEEEIKDICAKPVTITPGAYQKMLMHVLRFGSPGIPKEQWRECYGMCVGKFKNNKIIINDALPTTHGSDIGVEFVEQNYIVMAQFQDQLDRINAEIKNPEDKVFIVGWYHSHPGMERFLSTVDVRNQIAYQTSSFPFGVAIVFDNTCIFQEKAGQLDMGFKIFRLDDPTSTEINIPFSEVPFDRDILEREDLIELWKNDMQMIENIQKRSPFIKEYQETPSVFGDFKLPTTEQLKEAGTGITSEDRMETSVLPLADLDQLFTRGMQLFIEKYQTFAPEQKGGFTAFIEDHLSPTLNSTVEMIVSPLNNWTVKLRRDIDKRVNFGISTLNTMKLTMKETQDALITYLKEKADKKHDENKELSNKITEIELQISKILDKHKQDLKSIIKTMDVSWKKLIDNASKELEKTELAKIKAELKNLEGNTGGNNNINEKINSMDDIPLEKLQELLSLHLEKVQAMQEDTKLIEQERPPLVLGNFKIPDTNQIEEMNSFIPDSDDLNKNLLNMEGLGNAFKKGLQGFIQFYEKLPETQRNNFQEINEKGIQPFSDKFVSTFVQGINQWTVGLRDDIDRRVNLLVSIANEMQLTMKNIQEDYVEFLGVTTDPSARIIKQIDKTLYPLQSTAMAGVNSTLSYMQQVMENLIYYYQEQLERQISALDNKELKSISKSINQLKKSMK